MLASVDFNQGKVTLGTCLTSLLVLTVAHYNTKIDITHLHTFL